MKKLFLLAYLVLTTVSCSDAAPEVWIGVYEPNVEVPGGPDVVPLGPLPYREFADSPFATDTPSEYFYLEDFEDHLVNTPGVVSELGVMSGSFGYPTLIDSVDGDDKDATNDACVGCDAYFNLNGQEGVAFRFDANVLKRLPTHVGIAFTDASSVSDVVFTAFDANDNVLVKITGTNLADEVVKTSCLEDRFFGVIAPQGVQRITFYSTNGGIEADHLQYGVMNE